MKLRNRPSTSKTLKAPLADRPKLKAPKKERFFGTDLTNRTAPVANVTQMEEEEAAPRCQLQPYMGSILSHIESLDVAFATEMRGRVGRAQGGEWAVSAEMRRVLLRWLLQVGRKFQVMQETMHICAQIVDFVLVCEPARISKANFQLLGISALFVASKYNEIHTWEAEKYVFVCDGLYTVEQLFEMEGVILTATSFNLQFPTIHQFAAVALQQHGQHLAESVTMLANLVLFDFSLFNRFQKRHLACVILYIALKFDSPQQVRSRDMIEASNIPEEVFRECSQMLLALYQDRERIYP
jgi:cyclin B